MKKKSTAPRRRGHKADSGDFSLENYPPVHDAGDEPGYPAENCDFPDDFFAADSYDLSGNFHGAAEDVTPEAVLALFDARRPEYPGLGGRSRKKLASAKNGRRVIAQEEFLDYFGCRKGRKRKVENLLAAMTAEGRLIRLKGPSYALPERLSRLTGRISIQRQGIGFVRPDLPGRSNFADGTSLPAQPSARFDERADLTGNGHESAKARVKEHATEHARERVKERVGKKNNGLGRGRDFTTARTAEIYVHPSQLGGAWDGDRVLVALLPGQSGKNPEGRVLEVLERSLKEAAVVLLPEMVKEDGQVKRLARPLDSRLSGYLLVDLSGLDGGPGSRPNADETMLVSILPESAQRGDGVIRAKALTVLGAQKSLPLHERLVKAAHGIHTLFPPEVLDECDLLPSEPNPAEFFPTGPDDKVDAKNVRRDLRAAGFVTIDGEDARDFDDAIQVERTPSGYTLRVAIADVAHYVRPGSALDREALERGNSSYFPASVEPMLPEALSNGLCSLKPGTPRLALVAEIAFDYSGEPGKSVFYPALIESKGRLTYRQVHEALELKEESARAELHTHLPMLEVASELARLLMRKRTARGSLDFDLPEPKVLLNAKGEVEELRFSQRHFSNRLIEEFMIAANEAVARYLESIDASFLFRVHPAPDPDKLAVFFTTLERNGLLHAHGVSARRPGAYDDEASGVGAPGAGLASGTHARRRDNGRHSGAGKTTGKAAGKPFNEREGAWRGAVMPTPSAADLQAILNRVSGSAEEYVVNRLLLRSMMQARYTPAAEGHFGLASEAYCHFTSPIRRYADLTVHRVLRRSLGMAEPGGYLPSYEQLFAIADSLNESERNAVEAEREIHKISAALFLADRLGEEFEATVAGMSSFGLFVELKSMPVEGFLPVEELEDDFYRLDSERQMLVGLRGGRIYRLGQELRVVLDKADPARQEIRFFLSPESHPEAIGRKGKPLKGPARSGSGRKPSGHSTVRKKREKFKSGAVRVRNK